MAAQSKLQTPAVATSSAGDKILLDHANYFEWSLRTEKDLAGHGVLSVALANVPEPAGVQAANRHLKKREKAVQIIVNALSDDLYEKYKDQVATEDPFDLWQAIKADEGKVQKGSQSLQKIRDKLLAEQFIPGKESLQAYVARLNRYKIQLSGDDNPPTEVTIRNKLLSSLPKAGNWPTMAITLQMEDLSLGDTIRKLAEYQETWEEESTSVQTAEPSAHYANSRGRGRGRGRGGRGGQGRGGYNGERSGGWNNKGIGARGRGRGGGHRVRGGRIEKDSFRAKLDRNQCANCKGFGHWKRECTEDKDAYAKPNRTAKANRVEAIEEEDDAYPEIPHEDAHTAEHLETALLSITPSEPAWKLDSGASHHFSGMKSDFEKMKRWHDNKPVRIANNTFVYAEGYGDIDVAGFILKDVWYVPDFKDTRLVSIGQLADEGIHTVLGKTSARGYLDDQLVFSGSRNRGLYILDTQKQCSEAYVAEPSIIPQSKMKMETQPNAEETDADILHRRLGHINYAHLRKLVGDTGYDLKMIKVQQPKGEKNCEACSAGRMKEHFNKKTDRRTEEPIRRLHADISGILPVSIRGYRYFLLVVDDATRTCWVRLLPDKSARTIQPIIRSLRKQLETTGKSHNRVVVYWRTDNGSGEFGNEFLNWIREDGMTPEPSPPFKQSLNGVVERWMYELAKISRSILYDAKQGEEMWCYAIEWAAKLKNRRPTSALPYKSVTGLTPIEAYRGRPESLKKIRVFGAVATPMKPKDLRVGKMRQLSIPGKFILVGMVNSTTYKLLNVETFTELETADCHFDEYSTYIVQVKKKGIAKPVQEVKPKSLERRTERTQRMGNVPVQRPQERPSPRGGDGPANIAVRPATSAARSPLHEERPASGAESSKRPPVGRPAAGAERVGDTLGASDQRLPELTRETDVPVSAVPTSRFGRKQRRKVMFEQAHLARSMHQRTYGNAILQKAIECPIALIALQDEPVRPMEILTVDEALRDNPKEWKESVWKELSGIKAAGTYKIIFGRPPKGSKLISSRFVLRNKINSRGIIARRKSRLVVRGFEQQEGFDYFDTFASVIRHTTIRVLLAFAAKKNLEVKHIDIDTAFLNALLKEDVFMMAPDDEFPELWEKLHPELKGEHRPYYLKLVRSLYGLKQAPRAWWLLVKDEMEKLGLQSAESDPNLFIYTNPETKEAAYVLVFVDDMLIIGNTADTDYLKDTLLAKWKGKDLGDVDTFIGLEVQRNRKKGTLRIHQSTYTRKLLERFGMWDANGSDLPAKAGTVLRNSAKDEGAVILSPEETSLYQQIIGSLIYLSNLTRPDISYMVGQLARHMSAPLDEHLQATKPLLRYLRRTWDHGITYGNNGGGYGGSTKEDVFDVWADGELYETMFEVFTDATWGTEVDRKSFQGWLARFYGGVISFAANRQKSTALSSLDSEIMAASDGSREAAWLLKLWKDLGITSPRLPTLYLDNSGAESLTKERKFHPKAKHIDIRHFYIRDDMVKAGKLVVKHVPGNDNMADALTKALPSESFERYKRYMGLPGGYKEGKGPGKGLGKNQDEN